MAPLTQTLTTLLRRATSSSPSLTARALVPRSTSDPSAGVIDPVNVPNKAIFAVFALIGVGFVLTGIWFFFWAKNGGFYFREDDWDDYKTTVLRRRGPNGTTLSGATESTDLGGGSVVHGEKRSIWGKRKGGKKFRGREGSMYKDFEDETSTLAGTDLGSDLSDVKWKTEARKKAKKDKAKKEKAKKSPFGRDAMAEVNLNDGDEEMDVGVADTIRAYRHEKPARVGGLNKQADGSAFDGSTQDGSSAASELLSYREKTPTNTPTKKKTGGIRRVETVSQPSIAPSSSFWTKSSASNADTERSERIKSEAKKLQEKGRAAQRRDFSFQVGDDMSSHGGSSNGAQSEAEERRARREARRASRSPEKKIPGGYYEVAESDIGSEVSRDTGTKSYHHPIPGLEAARTGDYAEERRKKRNGGYRRDDN